VDSHRQVNQDSVRDSHRKAANQDNGNTTMDKVYVIVRMEESALVDSHRQVDQDSVQDSHRQAVN